MEWLNPWALWLTTTLAFPLWLHFRQRSRPKKADFPSLMLLRKGFPQAMQRKRLRDLLHLILRLLLLLCLVLALAQPRWREATAWPTHGRMLIDNTVTGMLPDAAHGTRLAAQWRESQNLESRFPDGLLRLPALPDADIAKGEERFGNAEQRMRRLLFAEESSNSLAALVIVPVLPSSLANLPVDLMSDWLEENSERRILLWQHGTSKPPEQWPQIAQAGISTETQPTAAKASLALKAMPIEPALESGYLIRHQGYERQLRGANGSWKIPLESEAGDFEKPGKTAQGQERGVFRLDIEPEWQGAWNRFHFTLNSKASARIVHVGDSWASLPSLTDPENRMAIEHWPAGMRLPELVTQGPNAIAAVMLSGRLPASEDLERVAAFVLDGGGLIITLGTMTDITSLNSRILSPLGLGRITGTVNHTAPKALKIMASGYANLNIDPTILGGGGEVLRHYRQAPSPGADTLLMTGGLDGGDPIAVHRQVGQGHLLLWNTSVDSLEWSTLGLQPLLPLTHQALLKTLRSQKRPVTLASDSIWVWPTTDPKAEVIGPDGEVFTRVRPSVEGLHLGPFSKVGFYTCRSFEETTTVVVNLVHPWSHPPLRVATHDTARSEQAEVEAFLTSLGKARDQVTLSDAPPSLVMGTKAGSSWPIWLALAVLLLLLDGLVALLYASPKPTGRAS